MKPDTTWKESLQALLASPALVHYKGEYAVIEYFIESLLSSSQALARREGIEEITIQVERAIQDGEEFTGQFKEGRKSGLLLAKVICKQALQEKLDQGVDNLLAR